MSKSLRLVVVVLAALVPGLAFAAPAWARATAKLVRFRGHTVAVPAGWPVYRLAASPGLCVRLDRSAVYLGQPSGEERCPAHAVGRARAILVAPRGRGVVVLRGAAAASRGAFAGNPGAAAKARRIHLSAPAGAVFSGRGFDACSAPSEAHLAAWLASPYRAVGIYVGGTNVACAQPNLSPEWVGRESAAGWHLIPTYVGLQAPVNSCACTAIDPGAASAEGAAAASDAAADASELGIGRGNPIYADIEYYPRTATNSAAVLAYLSAWTTELHADKYLSGVYGNSDSVIADLLGEQGTGYPEPDDIWFAEWNGERTASSSYIPPDAWPGHRLHQYEGGHDARYGGVTINIDSNVVDGATAAGTTVVPAAASPIPNGTFVELAGTSSVYRIAGGAPLFVSDWSAFGGLQPYVVITQQQFDALNAVPASGTLVETSAGTIYRIAGGAAFAVSDLAALGGVPAPVTIDQWDLEDVGNPLAHLNPAPADGTAVEGLPSGSYWLFESGRRRETAATPVAIPVDDQALDALPAVPCAVPKLRRMALSAVRLALREADCGLGTVRRPRRVRRGRILHVLGQSPRARARRPATWPVSVTLG